MTGWPSEGDAHLLYGAAHHDLWWAKGQLWTSTQWTIALFGVLVGAAGLVNGPTPLVDATTWPFGWLTTAIGFATVWYHGRLHSDIVRSRANTAFLRNFHPPLRDLFENLPKHGDVREDPYRGTPFVRCLQAGVAIGLGVALFALGWQPWIAVGFALQCFAWAIVALETQIQDAIR